MSLDRELTINDFINIIKRKFTYIVGSFLLLFPIVLAYAIWATPTYQSVATILIESPHVKSGAEREKFATERFAKLNQVVLSKENLVNLAKKYKLYGMDKVDKKPSISTDGLYFAIRNSIFIEKLKAEPEGWESSATFAFKVSFQYYDAKDTFNITNDLVKLFLDENDRVSKGQVLETVEFFSKEEAKRRDELEKIESEVTSYKRIYADALPENKGIYVGSIERLENDLRNNQLEQRSVQAELRSLDVSLESAKAGVGLNTPQQPISGSTDLDVLRQELAKQKIIYNDNHPTVRMLQRRIEALEKVAPTDPVKADKPISLQSVMVAKVQAQIDTANNRIESLRAEESNIRAKMGQAERSIIRSTQTEGALGALLREYESAKIAYAEIKSKLDNSKIAKNIEIENKGERFVLIEAPVYPDRPIKPNRKMIILGGFIGSILASIALVILLDLMRTGVKGVDTIASIVGVQPMVAIPYISSNAEEKRKKYIMYYFVIGYLGLVFIALFVIHIFVMPLDILMSKIAARF